MNADFRNMGLALDVLVDYVIDATIPELYNAALHNPRQKLFVGQQPFASCIIFGIGAALDIMSQCILLFQLFFHPNLSTFLRFWLDLVVYACKFSHQLYCSTNYLTFQVNYKISSSVFNLFICALYDNKSTEIL